MLTLPPRVRIYLALGATDMRKSIDGLEAQTRLFLKKDPLTGDFYIFCNRRRDRIKILYWEESGFWLLHKRLEKGTFDWPRLVEESTTHMEMSSTELAALLGGIDISKAPRRRWYRRVC